MCAAQNSLISIPTSQGSTPQVSTQQTTTPQVRNPKRNKHSHGGKQSNTPKQSNSAQKPSGESRNAKRTRWAKKSRPVAKSITKKIVYEYISKCCGMPASKPRCGTKEVVKDPDSGKMKDKAKGLGHWRCSGCKKVCSVIPRKPVVKEVVSPASPVGATIVVVDMGAVEQRVLTSLSQEVTDAPTS